MKTIVITGISRGIGSAVAALFLEKGWFVIGTSTTGSSDLTHPNLTCCSLDLSVQADIESFTNKVETLDVLINNAAILLERWDSADINMPQLRKTFDINVFGTIALTERLIPKLETQGQIINITSGWGSFSANDSPFQPHYKMSKTCLNMYTKILAERDTSFTVASFDPGWVKTDMGTNAAPTTPEETAQDLFTLISNADKPSGCFWRQGKQRAW